MHAGNHGKIPENMIATSAPTAEVATSTPRGGKVLDETNFGHNQGGVMIFDVNLFLNTTFLF